METINPEQFRNLSLPADEPLTTHLQTLIAENEAIIEEEAEATYIRLQGAEERIWVKTSDSVPGLPEEDAASITPFEESMFGDTQDSDGAFFPENISSSDKLRMKSKYYLGSTIVNVVFLSGPKVQWTPVRKAAFLRDMIDQGHQILNRVGRNDGKGFPKHKFVTTSEEFYMATDPALVPIISGTTRSYDELGINIKGYLTEKGVYHGNMNDYKGFLNQADVLQAFYQFVNILRDRYSTDWGYLVFVVPDPNTPSRGRAHARAIPGFLVLFERPAAYPWTVAHEALHMYGALDEYVDVPTDTTQVSNCRIRRGGLYDINNTNCQTSDGNQCMMSAAVNNPKAIWRERICTVTAEQLSLIQESDGSYKPEKDFAVHTYEITDDLFNHEGGVFLVSDVIRKNKSVWVQVTGNAKMNHFYSQHGPDGDLNTIVGQDHLLPGRPFQCVIAKWVSIDGTNHGSWFHVGKGEQWYKAPITAYLVFNVNDKKGTFNDNSGYMKVALWSKLTDNYGPVFVLKNIWPSSATAIHAVELNVTTFEEAGIREEKM